MYTIAATSFKKWIINYLQNAYEFYLNCLINILLSIFSIHIIGPTTIQNQIL